MNRIILIGYLGKDAEVKTTRNGAAFTQLSLATRRSWKDRQTDEYRSETTWHRCVVWGKLGLFAGTLTKGAHLQLEGEIRTRQYLPKAAAKNAGEPTKSITEVRVSSLTKLHRAKKTAEETVPQT